MITLKCWPLEIFLSCFSPNNRCAISICIIKDFMEIGNENIEALYINKSIANSTLAAIYGNSQWFFLGQFDFEWYTLLVFLLIYFFYNISSIVKKLTNLKVYLLLDLKSIVHLISCVNNCKYLEYMQNGRQRWTMDWVYFTKKKNMK